MIIITYQASTSFGLCHGIYCLNGNHFLDLPIEASLHSFEYGANLYELQMASN